MPIGPKRNFALALLGLETQIPLCYCSGYTIYLATEHIPNLKVRARDLCLMLGPECNVPHFAVSFPLAVGIKMDKDRSDIVRVKASEY